MKLIGNGGDSMFICHAEEELNLDEFETDIDYDEGDAAVAFDIKTVAASFVGEHDCIFDQIPIGLNSERIKLMVTTEANAINQITSNTEFKAELIVERATTVDNQITENIYVNCPKSGKQTSFIITYVLLQCSSRICRFIFFACHSNNFVYFIFNFFID